MCTAGTDAQLSTGQLTWHRTPHTGVSTAHLPQLLAPTPLDACMAVTSNACAAMHSRGCRQSRVGCPQKEGRVELDLARTSLPYPRAAKVQHATQVAMTTNWKQAQQHTSFCHSMRHKLNSWKEDSMRFAFCHVRGSCDWHITCEATKLKSRMHAPLLAPAALRPARLCPKALAHLLW